jgi:hypothetical protein
MHTQTFKLEIRQNFRVQKVSILTPNCQTHTHTLLFRLFIFTQQHSKLVIAEVDYPTTRGRKPQWIFKDPIALYLEVCWTVAMDLSIEVGDESPDREG